MAVENPMSLVITSDTTIGVTLEASVPTTETQLFYITGAYLDKNGKRYYPCRSKSSMCRWKFLI